MRLYLLSCLHTVMAKSGRAQIFCLKCRDWKNATHVLQGDWVVTCPDCKKKWKYGQGQITAETAAAHHSRKYPTHVPTTKYIRNYQQNPVLL